MDLFAGLENLGISGIDSTSLFAEEEATKDDKGKKEETVVPQVMEEDLLFDKTYTCPICDREFKNRVIRSNKSKLLGTDNDLRPIYANIDALKYDIVACPRCGYAAMTRYFGPLSSAQIKMLRQGICDHYLSKSYSEPTYSYEDALERYKLALANAMVRKAKSSEKAYICLKTGWILRGMAESKEAQGQEATVEREQEEAFMKNAYDGLLLARQSELPPICGMDEITVDYLLAVLAMRFKQYEVSARLISEILTKKTANNRIKEKTRDLKVTLLEELKKRNAQQQ